jgi:hypothetical protein
MGDTLGLRDTQSPQSILEVKIINPNNFQFQRNSVVSHMDLVPIFGLVFVIFGPEPITLVFQVIIRIGYFRDHQRVFSRPIRNVATFVPSSISMSGITFDMIGLSLSNLSISRIRSPFFLLFRKGSTRGNPSFSWGSFLFSWRSFLILIVE